MNLYRRSAEVGPGGVSARFATREAANRATRALQKQLKLPPEHVGVSLAPGIDPGDLTGEGGYLGVTKAGALLVHARVADAPTAQKVRDLLGRLGGEVVDSQRGTPSTGGYGPTTASGTRGVFGGAPGTSAMVNHLFTQAEEPPEDPADAQP